MNLWIRQNCKLKEEEVDGNLLRTRFGRGYGRAVRETTALIN
jgi:hypothetical protein